MKLATVALLALCLAGCPQDEDDGSETSLEWVSVAENYDRALLSGWASSPTDVWVVGGDAEGGIALQYDGAAWVRHQDFGANKTIWWVHGLAGGDVWVAGEEGFIGRFSDGTWTATDSTLPLTTFYGIWAGSANEAWAVGGPGAANPAGSKPFAVARWDGTAWSAVDAPVPDGPGGSNMYKVWGAGPGHAIAVGDRGVAIHWDGTSWKAQDTGAQGTLFTVSGLAADDAWAIGGLGVPELVHWDGTSWSSVELPVEAPALVQGLWAAPGGELFVAGSGGWTAARSAGGDWRSASGFSTNDVYHAIFGDGEGGLFACGGDIFEYKADYHGVLSFNGTLAGSPPP